MRNWFLRFPLGFAVCVLGLAPACGGPADTTAAGRAGGAGDGGVHWDDPAGDVAAFANAPDQPRPDITRVTVDAAGGELIVAITTARPLAELFDDTAPDGRKSGATLASLTSSDMPASSARSRTWTA